MKQNTLRTLAAHIGRRDLPAARALIDVILETETGVHWRRDLLKLADVIDGGAPRFTILARGNSKLPFVAFSALPGGAFCPGAGACLQFCYSFRAWRYPAAFCRQAQNTILMQTDAGRGAILQALDAHDGDRQRARRNGEPLPFRLYVDGDFSSVSDVSFWMAALIRRPWLAAYGYSKSWDQLLAFNTVTGIWPENYRLNLSSGSRHGADKLARIAALPITRGEFIAVPLGRKVRSTDHGNRAHQAELRKAYGAPAFTCPGKCGECTPKGHACGSARFAGVPIIIAVH